MTPLNSVEQRLQKEKAKDSDGEQNALQSCEEGHPLTSVWWGQGEDMH